MSNLIASIILIVIFIVVFVVLPVLAIQLFVYLAPVILVVYILYKIFGPKRNHTTNTSQHHEAPRNNTPDDVVDVAFTVHEVKDDEDKE